MHTKLRTLQIIALECRPPHIYELPEPHRQLSLIGSMADDRKQAESNKSVVQTARAWGGRPSLPSGFFKLTSISLPAKPPHRKPGTSSPPCYLRLRPTCPAIPTIAY